MTIQEMWVRLATVGVIVISGAVVGWLIWYGRMVWLGLR